jgi:YD repeat-containing protein
MALRKKIIFIVSSILLIAIPSTSDAALNLKLTNNNSSYADSDVHVMFYGGALNATYSGGAIAQKKDYTLSQFGAAGITINSYLSGIIYVALGNALTQNRTGEPSASNSSDADYNTRWDRFELTYTPSDSDVADLTGINLYSIPIQLETSKGGTATSDKLTYAISGNEMRLKLGALTNQDPTSVIKDAAGNFLRVIGPSQYGAGDVGPYKTFDDYANSIKDSGLAIAIADHYNGYGTQSTAPLKAQDYTFSAKIDKTSGDMILTGSGTQIGTNHTIVISQSDFAYAIYANDPPYKVDGVTKHVGDNDVYSAIVRDVLSGFAIGFVGSSVIDPVTGKAFKDEQSKNWFAQTSLAFSAVEPDSPYYNAYAEIFYLYSNSYGFPFSDRLHKAVQINIGPAKADTLLMTILTDGVTYKDSVTQAKSNAQSPASWRAAASSIVTVPDPGATHGLKYDASGKLIVRTLSKSSYFSGNYAGQPNYTIYGAPATDAAWVTTGNDLTGFYDNKGENSRNSDLIKILERGLGMNDTGTHNAVIEYAVTANNDNIMRPTKNPDIATYNPTQYGDNDTAYPFVQPAGMSTSAYNNFVAYYNYWRNLAYTTPYDATKSAPFTQLGYTYFWGYGTSLSDIQGMSEFILPGGTSVDIYGIYSTASYIYTKNDGEYGNGYASFDITGPCDTVWAGHRFQKGVSCSASSPNHITISKGVTISGGEGLLVWSLNYDVTNNGTISGATANKFGIAGTNNIGILFKGDTSTTYGTPVTEGGNKLTNSGTINSTGTGVKSENGNTTIINNTGASIAGDTCGIWLMNGTNTITNHGTIDCPGATAIRISAGTTTLSNPGTINGNMILDADPTAVLDIGAQTVKCEEGGTYTQGAGATLKLTVNSSANYGKIKAENASTLDAGSKIFISAAGNIDNNSTLTVVDTAGAGVGSLPGTISTDSAFYTFTGSIDSNDLVITATRTTSYNSFASSSNTGAVSSVLNTMAVNNTATGDMVTVLSNLDTMTQAEEINAAMESMLPSYDNSVPQVTQASLNQFISVSVSRLDNFQELPSAMINDLEPKGPDIWAQGFGSYLHQDPMASSNGYNASVWGTALGFDLPITRPLKIGASGGFAQDYIRTKDSSGRTDINSYAGALYATYGWERFFIDIMPAFAYNTYDSSRNVTVGALDRTAYGEYNGQQYTGYFQCGYKIDIKKVMLTPVASFQYTHLRINSYEETGAGALNLKVVPQDSDLAQTGLGLKLARPIEAGSCTLIPEIRVKWLYDWIGDAQQLTSTFTGGGGGFTTNGSTPAQSSYDFGTKLTLATKLNVTLSVNYDLEIKEDFYSHNGYAELRYAF